MLTLALGGTLSNNYRTRALEVALNDSGHAKEASNALTGAIEAESQNTLLWDERSSVNFKRGRTDEGLADLRQALVLKLDLASAQNSLGIALALSGDAQGAQAAFEVALAIDAYDAGAQANLLVRLPTGPACCARPSTSGKLRFSISTVRSSTWTTPQSSSHSTASKRQMHRPVPPCA